eukprot:TRINITY_DN3237_c1_g3_i1.p1 TRINITY_DN3237_c1_g3~~TRINITY_DN3237_c1_g3_i1.p1  ORF type:complete len:426 (+),score=63.03 TRINITY_DN3237_c1_g3_i1:49-1326(+)
MQVVVSFPDSGLPDVVFEAAIESLVADATQAAAGEWGADAEFLEMSFSGSVLPQGSRLMSHGVEAGAQLLVSFLRVFGYRWFTCKEMNTKLMQHLSKLGEKHLSLDTPTFATDGHFRFDMTWLPVDFEISFVNPHPSVTSASFRYSHSPDDEGPEDCEDPEFESYESCYVDYGDHVQELFAEYPVVKVDLTGLQNITSTGDLFLYSCNVIKTLDVQCLSGVIEIGDSFLWKCSSLSSLDLTSFTNVTTIGNDFLEACESLTSLDLSGLTNVTKIGSYFLKGCSSLASLNLKSLNSVTAIDDCFLQMCSSLSSLDLMSLDNVTVIASGFLDGCSSLSSLDLTNFNNITAIDSYFLNECSSLSSLDLNSLTNVNKLGPSFLAKCSSLSEVDVSHLSPTSVVKEQVETMKFEADGSCTFVVLDSRIGV